MKLKTKIETAFIKMKAAYDTFELAQNAANVAKHGFQLRQYDGMVMSLIRVLKSSISVGV